jgi:DNA-binding transcriptional MerR regulator
MPGHAVSRFDEPTTAVFTVSQVADVLGVQQAFLRRLDTQALVSPARSDGGQRRYSRADIGRIEAIVGMVDEGLTLAGIKRVLELQAEVTELRRQVKQLGG